MNNSKDGAFKRALANFAEEGRFKQLKSELPSVLMGLKSVFRVQKVFNQFFSLSVDDAPKCIFIKQKLTQKQHRLPQSTHLISAPRLL